MPGSSAKTSQTSGELDGLRSAIRRRFGAAAEIGNVVFPTLGGSNVTIVFDVVEGTARRRLVSRQESYAGENNPFIPSWMQFRVMQLAYANKVPVPEPVFEYEPADEMGSGYVTAFVEGETLPNRVLRSPDFAEARARIVGQFGETFARLHSIDVAPIGFLEKTPDSIDPIMAQRDRMDAYGEDHPALELGFRWLERNRPAPSPRRLLHGDFRTGNLMIARDGLRAVLDWECCHIGSAAEDLGWLCTRSWRFGLNDRPVGGFGNREDLINAYAAAGGSKVEIEQVRYWEVFGLVRWAVINIMQAHGHVFGGRRSLSWAACGRNVSLIEYELLMTLAGRFD